MIHCWQHKPTGDRCAGGLCGQMEEQSLQIAPVCQCAACCRLLPFSRQFHESFRTALRCQPQLPDFTVVTQRVQGRPTSRRRSSVQHFYARQPVYHCLRCGRHRPRVRSPHLDSGRGHCCPIDSSSNFFFSRIRHPKQKAQAAWSQVHSGATCSVGEITTEEHMGNAPVCLVRRTSTLA